MIRLEEWSKQSDARFGRIESKLDIVIDRLGRVPTRTDLIAYTTAVLAVMMAVLGLFVGGMSWLEGRAARLSPSSPVVTAGAPALAAPPVQSRMSQPRAK